MNEPEENKPKDRKLSGIELYQFLGNGLLERSRTQQKCQEVSIQITTALAVGFAAFAYKLLENPQAPAVAPGSAARWPILFVIGLYALIQELILANYLYQTLQLGLLDIAHRAISSDVVKSLVPSMLEKTRQKPHLLARIGVWVIGHFQPAILYSLTFLGWCGFACMLFGFKLPRWLLVFPGLGVVFLLLFGVCHFFMFDFAKCWAHVDIRGGSATSLRALWSHIFGAEARSQESEPQPLDK